MLIGMMGAGKSSVGRRLQGRTGLARFDTDEMVSTKFGLAIPEIFARHGEEVFRDAETEAIGELPWTQSAVVVTGGGIVLRDANVDLLKRLGAVVWLEADADTLFERASRRGNRPLLKTENPRDTIATLLQERAPLYAKAADFRVDTSKRTHDEVADVILEAIESRSVI